MPLFRVSSLEFRICFYPLSFILYPLSFYPLSFASIIDTLTTYYLTDEELRLISDLVYQKFGIVLGQRKRALIVGRLQKVLRQSGFSHFKAYYDYVLNDASGQALSTLIDRISTNHTFFFRENEHFTFLAEKVLPEIEQQRQNRRTKKLKIWIAGCSSGEEPYTIAMIILEYFGTKIKEWNLNLLATDISTPALQKAVAAVYQPDNLTALPKKFLINYFQKLPDGNYQVQDNVRKMILFRRLNLIKGAFPFKSEIDIIFCRNVMIYFDRETRARLVDAYANLMPPGGWLFIGHSESIGRDNPNFKYIQPAVYRKIVTL